MDGSGQTLDRGESQKGNEKQQSLDTEMDKGIILLPLREIDDTLLPT